MSTGTAEWGAAPVAQQGLSNDWGSDAMNAVGGAIDPLADLDADEAKVGSGKIDIAPPVGKGYHLEVMSAELAKDEHGNPIRNRNDRFYINCRLVAIFSSPGLSPQGSWMYYEIEIPNPDDKEKPTSNGSNWYVVSMSVMAEFLLGVGLFRKQVIEGKEKVIDPATGTAKWNLKTIPDRLKGMQFIGRPTRRDWTDKEGKPGFSMEFDYGRGASRIDDPRNVDVPMNEAALKAAGLRRHVAQQSGAAQQSTPAGQTQQARQAAPVQQANPAAAAPGKFDDL
jgi:hypothetical protein